MICSSVNVPAFIGHPRFPKSTREDPCAPPGEIRMTLISFVHFQGGIPDWVSIRHRETALARAIWSSSGSRFFTTAGDATPVWGTVHLLDLRSTRPDRTDPPHRYWLLHAFGAGAQCEHQPNCERAESVPPDLPCFLVIKRSAAPAGRRLLSEKICAGRCRRSS